MKWKFSDKGVIPDISKAFDKVWHEDILFKLNENGLTSNNLSALGNFLRESLNYPWKVYISNTIGAEVLSFSNYCWMLSEEKRNESFGNTKNFTSFDGFPNYETGDVSWKQLWKYQNAINKGNQQNSSGMFLPK